MKVFLANTAGDVMHLMKQMTTAATAPKSTLENIVKVSKNYSLSMLCLSYRQPERT